MAWIESHQELRRHPKLIHLRQILSAEWPNVSAVHLIGHLHCLWWWCMDYALDGDLSKFSSPTIAEASGWEEKAEPFVNALIGSGWLDKEDSLNLKVHDWHDFCGELIKKRLARREEKKRKAEENGRKYPPKSAENPPTVPNRTKPNQTNTPPNPLKGERTQGFDTFWKEYPKKVGKRTARLVWTRLKPPLDLVLTSLKDQAQSEQWQKDGGRFIPNPTTWLNRGGWEDEVLPKTWEDELYEKIREKQKKQEKQNGPQE